MKVETIRFIIDYVTPWAEDKVDNPSCNELYQKYLEWCVVAVKKHFPVTFSVRKYWRKILSVGKQEVGRESGIIILDRFKL